jgi:hypothetical protein
MADPEPPSWDVEARVVATAAHARIVRALVTSCASRAPFSVEEIEDVRLLADEVFVVLCETGAQWVRVAVAVTSDDIILELRATEADRWAAVDTTMVELVAGMVAPGATMAFDEEPPTFHATVRRGRLG